jgi:molybdopterin molybdotransferase
MAPTSVDEHAAYIRSIVSLPTASERMPLASALDRVTAAAVHSPVDLPLFRNSQMDGFAVRAADLGEGPLPIVGEIAARPGTPPRLEPGTTVRIMTGAVVPDGADAVVPVEDTTVDGDTVTILRPRSVGEYVRERGGDVRSGDELLPAGQRLASRHLAVLAAAGISTVDVRTRVRIVIITTGAELVLPNTDVPLQLGQVYDSNSVALDAAARACGAEVRYAIHNDNDDVERLRAAMLVAKEEADIILTSGGISMGEHEVVRDFLEQHGGRIGHVAMQPGGPQATGSFHGVPIISFPGNPVSTQISFEMFVAPLLREAAGLPPAQRATRTLTADLRSVPGKRQFLRGRTVEGGRVDQVAGPGSHLVASLAASDVLIIVPEGTTKLKAGDTVETIEL